MELFSSWTGSDFLMFYIALLGLCTFAAWWMPAHLRSGGRRGESADAESLDHHGEHAAIGLGGTAGGYAHLGRPRENRADHREPFPPPTPRVCAL